MKLSRLYSNREEFAPIDFNEGLSVVYAEIRVPQNRDLDTHNLGKTTIGELIDFCLIKGKSKSSFLYKHHELFAGFTFYLELELPGGSYVTIARPVDPGTRIDFLRTSRSVGLTELPEAAEWDHTNVPFERAKKILDGMLDLEPLKPWGFRMVMGYLIRTQADYQDVFQLRKFSGKHLEWKPFVAHLLGMDANSAIDLYQRREELAEANNRLETLTREWGGGETDPSVLDGLIAVKRRDVASLAETMDSFNFEVEDRRVTADVVETLEFEIADLNEEKYHLVQLLQRLRDSLQVDAVVFDPDQAEKLFEESGVLLGSKLKRSYEQLIAFNRAITEERRNALLAQIDESEQRIAAIEPRLRRLNDDRAQSLEFLRQSESLAKYKDLGRTLASQESELKVLEINRESVARLSELRREYRRLNEEYGHQQTLVEEQLDDLSKSDESHFGRMRQYFTEIIFEVLGQNAILAIKMNAQGGLDFVAEFIGDAGTATSEDRGTSYKKLLCIAFDLAMLRSYADSPFPRFVYHDGALEQLEPRKRQKLIGVLRRYASYGLQPIVSVLDSDLPEPLNSASSAISDDEVVLTLHDEGDEGRLFRMTSW